jgi:hypothetical protein
MIASKSRVGAYPIRLVTLFQFATFKLEAETGALAITTTYLVFYRPRITVPVYKQRRGVYYPSIRLRIERSAPHLR